MRKPLFGLTLSIALLVIAGSLQRALGAEQKKIKTGIYNFYPLCHTDPAKLKECIFPALLEHIAEKEGWDISYEPGTLDDGLNKVTTGEIDLQCAVAYSKELDSSYDFTQETILSTWALLYTHPDVTIRSLVECSSHSVGVVQDDPYNQELRSLVKRFNIACSFVEFKHYEDLLSALEQKWIDVGVVDRLYGLMNERKHVIIRTTVAFSPIELRFAVKNDSNAKIIAALDYHLSTMKKDPFSLYFSLIQQSLSENKPFQIPKIVLVIGFMIIGLVLLLIGMSIILQSQVKAKTNELQKTNEELRNEIEMRNIAEDALRQSKQMLEKTIACMHDGLLSISKEGERIITCNKSATNLFGYSHDELLGLPLARLFDSLPQHENFMHMLTLAITEKGFFELECKMKRRDNSNIPAEIVVSPIYDDERELASWVMTVRDSTLREELRKNEKLLRQAQKLEAIGTLAGGIAHDFNNILMPISGYTELLMKFEMSGINDNAHKYLDQILQATQRAKDLVSQILAFSRQRDQERLHIHIGPIIKEVLKLIRASLPTTISIMPPLIDLEADSIFADPTQIHQVIMNLCANASHAMKERGGTLEVGIVKHTGAVRGWSEQNKLGTGEFCRMWIRDTGKGIDPAILHRIFDPFFTTKMPGEGTGMGLAVVHGIISSHHGLVSVESHLGEGTTFHIYLPIASKPVVENLPAPFETPITGTESILLVDDEWMIVESSSRLLQKLGYSVTPLTDSIQAFTLFKNNPQAFDVVITDQTIPQMTGIEMAQKMLAIRPDLPIILCTGYSQLINKDKALQMGIRHFVMKPFMYTEIAAVIRKILDHDDLVACEQCAVKPFN